MLCDFQVWRRQAEAQPRGLGALLPARAAGRLEPLLAQLSPQLAQAPNWCRVRTHATAPSTGNVFGAPAWPLTSLQSNLSAPCSPGPSHTYVVSSSHSPAPPSPALATSADSIYADSQSPRGTPATSLCLAPPWASNLALRSSCSSPTDSALIPLSYSLPFASSDPLSIWFIYFGIPHHSAEISCSPDLVVLDYLGFI